MCSVFYWLCRKEIYSFVYWVLFYFQDTSIQYNNTYNTTSSSRIKYVSYKWSGIYQLCLYGRSSIINYRYCIWYGTHFHLDWLWHFPDISRCEYWCHHQWDNHVSAGPESVYSVFDDVQDRKNEGGVWTTVLAGEVKEILLEDISCLIKYVPKFIHSKLHPDPFSPWELQCDLWPLCYMWPYYKFFCKIKIQKRPIIIREFPNWPPGQIRNDVVIYRP